MFVVFTDMTRAPAVAHAFASSATRYLAVASVGAPHQTFAGNLAGTTSIQRPICAFTGDAIGTSFVGGTDQSGAAVCIVGIAAILLCFFICKPTPSKFEVESKQACVVKKYYRSMQRVIEGKYWSKFLCV